MFEHVSDVNEVEESGIDSDLHGRIAEELRRRDEDRQLDDEPEDLGEEDVGGGEETARR